MISLKRFSLLLLGLLLTVFIVACNNPMSSNTATGSNTTATNNSGNATGYGNSSKTAAPTMVAQNNKMATPTTTMGNNNKMATPTTTMGNSMNNSNAFIHTTQVKLNGSMVTVLTNAKGMILYYKLNDPKPQSACTGTCATDWPPVLATSMNMMTVSSSMQLPHKLTVVKTANGNQIEYDGHPLYTYAGDMAPGQFAGRGMGNVWYLVGTGL